MVPPTKTTHTVAQPQSRVHDAVVANVNTPKSEGFKDWSPVVEQWKGVLTKKESRMEELKTARETLVDVANGLKEPPKPHTVKQLRNKIKAIHVIMNGELTDTQDEIEQVESIIDAFEDDSMVPTLKNHQMRLVLQFMQVMHHADQNLTVKDLWAQMYGSLATAQQSSATPAEDASDPDPVTNTAKRTRWDRIAQPSVPVGRSADRTQAPRAPPRPVPSLSTGADSGSRVQLGARHAAKSAANSESRPLVDTTNKTRGPNTSTAAQKPVPTQQGPRIRLKTVPVLTRSSAPKKSALALKAAKSDEKSIRKSAKRSTSDPVDDIEDAKAPSDNDKVIVETVPETEHKFEENTGTTKAADEAEKKTSAVDIEVISQTPAVKFSGEVEEKTSVKGVHSTLPSPDIQDASQEHGTGSTDEVKSSDSDISEKTAGAPDSDASEDAQPASEQATQQLDAVPENKSLERSASCDEEDAMLKKHALAEDKAPSMTDGVMEQSTVCDSVDENAAQDVKDNEETNEGSTDPSKEAEGTMSEATKKNVSQSTSEDSGRDASSDTSRKPLEKKPVKGRPGRRGARVIGEAGVAKPLTAAQKRRRKEQQQQDTSNSRDESESESENEHPKPKPEPKNSNGNKKRRLSEETIEESEDNVRDLKKAAHGAAKKPVKDAKPTASASRMKPQEKGHKKLSPKKTAENEDEPHQTEGGGSKPGKHRSRKSTATTASTKRKRTAGDDDPAPSKKVDRKIAVPRTRTVALITDEYAETVDIDAPSALGTVFPVAVPSSALLAKYRAKIPVDCDMDEV